MIWAHITPGGETTTPCLNSIFDARHILKAAPTFKRGGQERPNE
jgi:hypothetical protein